MTDDTDRGEWSGRQDRALADSDYYALHFEARVTMAKANQLLNKFGSAERVIHWAKEKPDRLTAMHGIGERTVEKIAAIDEDAIKSPRERGTPISRLRQEGIGPEKGGLSEFVDDSDDSDD